MTAAFILVFCGFLVISCSPARSGLNQPEPSEGGQDLMTVSCPELLVFSRESGSRSGICIRLGSDDKACRIRGIVGGEHISYLGVRGPEGSRYRIDFTPVQGRPGYTVHWPEAVPVLSGPGSGTKTIGPIDTPGFILACSAHPFGEYSLSIRLLPADD